MDFKGSSKATRLGRAGTNNKALPSSPVTSPLSHCRGTQRSEAKAAVSGVLRQHRVFSWSQRGSAHTLRLVGLRPAHHPQLDSAGTSAVAHGPEAGSTARGGGQEAGDWP